MVCAFVLNKQRERSGILCLVLNHFPVSVYLCVSIFEKVLQRKTQKLTKVNNNPACRKGGQQKDS